MTVVYHRFGIPGLTSISVECATKIELGIHGSSQMFGEDTYFSSKPGQAEPRTGNSEKLS